MRRYHRIALGVAVAVGLGTPVAAQVDSAALREKSWVRPLASLFVPGMGQALSGQDRAAVYGAVELYALSRYIQVQHDANVNADLYHQLAFAVAQRGFASARRDTIFEYYEQMEKFTASGRFSLGSGAAIVPETDPTTYNGSVWLLARRTYWADPDVPPPLNSQPYLAADSFYVRHAIGPHYYWSWQNSSLQQQSFRDLIKTSDDGYRNAQGQLGILLANHIVSALDALISNRLTSATHRTTSLQTFLTPAFSLVSVRVAF
ncbi:MAG TPA: hypothetical protein VH163_02340 [Gemmatimonadales bacterium]|jgi:hypothetical protein|nr:hypothetical protein [Gemmatimonadales bacterium]